MSNAQEVLERALESGVFLFVEGDRLRYRARREGLPSDLRAELERHRDEIVRHLKRIQARPLADRLEPPAIRRREPSERVPLSFAQRRLWFIDRLGEGSTQYQATDAYRVIGPLNRSVLRRVFTTIVERHESLRTVVGEEQGSPYQVLLRRYEIRLPVIDLVGLSGSHQEVEVRRVVASVAARPFDLSRDVMLRVLLIVFAPESHGLVIGVHHIATDAWSIGVLHDEFQELYLAYEKGEQPDLAPLELQYGDYAVWQRVWLRGDVLLGEVEYWRRELAGAPEVHHLPIDRERPPYQGHAGGAWSRRIGAELEARILSLCRRCDVTLFMFLQTAFAVLVGRYADDSDVVMGVPVTGRIRAELEPIIGLFVNTLVLRTRWSEDLTFEALLQRNKRHVLDGFAHQHVPLETLVERLRPTRTASYNPLFQVMFTFESQEPEPFSLPGLRFEEIGGGSMVSKFDLILSVTASSRGLFLDATYSAELFFATTVARLVEGLVALLEAVVEAPDRPIRDLDPLCRAARHRLLHELNDQPEVSAPARGLHERFQAVAGAHPDRLALEAGGRSLSFGELDEAARTVALQLRARGVGPGSLVAVSPASPPEAWIALLGVWQAGAAFVLLPGGGSPADRSAILNDSGAGALVTAVLPAPRGGGWEAEVEALAPVPDPRRSGRDDAGLAYLVYGLDPAQGWQATGVTHRDLENHASWRACLAAPVTGADESAGERRVLGLERPDPETLAALAGGATLSFPAPVRGDDGEGLARWVEIRRITSLSAGPAVVESLLPQWSRCASLREVVLSRGHLAPRLLEHFFRVSDRCELYSLYSPRPATPAVTVRRCSPSSPGIGVPLGRQLPNLSLRVLDGNGNLMPEGAHGELWVSGYGPAGSAHGVGGPPDLATGDLVRWGGHGRLEYLGRVEDRVRVGTRRVDLSGFRAVLSACEWVARFAVATGTDPAGEELVVAYVVAGEEGAEALSARLGELGRELATTLDAPAAPFAVLAVEQIPVGPTGEVDLSSLPPPEGPFRPEAELGEPETEIERRMAPLWAKLLSKEWVGVEEDFFAAGGNSLSMIVLIKRISQELGVDVPLVAFIESPTVRGTARWVEARLAGTVSEPTPGRAEAALSSATAAAVPERSIVPLPPGAHDRPLPVSFAQARIWFITRLESERSSYNVAGALRLTGPLRRRSLRRALATVVARHKILRTVYREEGQHPVQVILRDAVPAFPLVDLTDLPSERRAEVLRQEVRDESFRPFDLSGELPLRTRLFALAEHEHVLLVDMHHVATDGWSIGVFTRELAALYQAYRQGRPDPLPALPLQYCDYAAWQREWLQGAVVEGHLGFWREYLKDLPKVHALPLDRPRPPYQSYLGAHHEVTVGEELVRGLDRLGRAHDSTPFMTLHALLAVLIHRYSGAGDLVIGVPVANRVQPEVEPLIGCFVNTLALRTDLSENPAFSALLRANREGFLRAYAHQSLPFEVVVEELNPARDLRHAPLFQILLAYQDVGGEEITWPGLEVAPLEADYPVSKLDLSLYARPEDDRLVLVWEYATDLFTQATVERLAASFHALLESAVRTPDVDIRSLRLMTEAEERQLLARQEAAVGGSAGEVCLHELVEARVREAPDALAVVDGRGAWSRGALDAWAEQLARYLRSRGVGAGDLIGICAERTVQMVVAVLGVLKTGAGYVPLDPAYPAQRLRFMLEDSGARMVLASEPMRDLLPVEARSLIVLDDLPPSGAARSRDEAELGDREERLDPGRLAYVIYTSGSTGRPKGVGISHRSAVAFLRWAEGAFSPEELSGVLASTSLSFDLSIFELFAPLAGEGTMIVAANVLELPGAEWRWWVRLVNTVPSVMNELLRLGGLPPCVRTVNLAGEVLDGTLARKLLATGVRLLNLYGPSEATTYATGSEVTGVGEPTIGTPIRGTRAYVLDRRLRAVPVGVVDGLYLGGAGLAWGYLGRPELTADRFVPDPCSGEAGARLYRTGDLARWRPDGDLEYLGRLDHQVKVRGFRIELGEIEAALRSHPQVADAVVAVGEGEASERRLVAYLVSESGGGAPARLRSWLGQRLPEHMVPSAYVVLAKLPLTPNGKLDRRALPPPDEDHVESRGRVPPSTDTERRLCSIWQDLLRLRQVGIEDDFFELGGHSLLAARLISAVREEFDLEVPLRLAFEKPNVLAFATWLDLYRYGATAAVEDGAADEGEEVLL